MFIVGFSYGMFPQKYGFSVPELKTRLGQTPARFHRPDKPYNVFALD